MVAKLKADAEQRTSQLRSLVEKMMTKQGTAIANADSMWSFLAMVTLPLMRKHRNRLRQISLRTATGVLEQTSDRILDFAKALPATIRKKQIF